MENGRVQKDLIREFPIPYAILDKTGRLAWVNDEFAHITNTSKRKLMRLTAMQVFEGLTHEMIPTTPAATLIVNIQISNTTNNAII